MRARRSTAAASPGSTWIRALTQHQTGDTAAVIETQQRAISLIPDGAGETMVAELQTNLCTLKAALADPTGA